MNSKLENSYNLKNYYQTVKLQEKIQNHKKEYQASVKQSRANYKTFFDLLIQKRRRIKDAKLTRKEQLLSAKDYHEINIVDLKDDYAELKKKFKHDLQFDSWNKNSIKKEYLISKFNLSIKIRAAKLANKRNKSAMLKDVNVKQAIIKINDNYVNEIKQVKKDIREIKLNKQINKQAKKSHIETKKNLYSDFLTKRNSIKKEIHALKIEKRRYRASLKTKEDKVLFHKSAQLVKNRKKAARGLKFDQIERKVFKKFNPAYIYIMPAFIGSLFFTLLPFIFMIVVAFCWMDPLKLDNLKFRGLNNFIMLFTRDREFQMAITNTLYFALFTIIALMIITVLLAAWLSKNTRIHNITQTMVFTPHIASLVSVSILWIALLNPEGVINYILSLFGIEGPRWLLDTRTSLISVALVTVWKSIGYYVLIIISGLQAIPSYVYEAAKLDKASRFNTFTKITIPLLSPTLVFVFIVKFINSFKVFASIDIMTKGGPVGSSMVLGYKIYQYARIGNNYGNAMAAAIILTLMIGTATFINYRFFNKRVVYQ